MIRSPKIGQQVEMRGNLGKILKAIPKPRIGIITAVNGEYILVKPVGLEWEQEFYRNELRELAI